MSTILRICSPERNYIRKNTVGAGDAGGQFPEPGVAGVDEPALLAVRDEHRRTLPGRLVGVSIDIRALALTVKCSVLTMLNVLGSFFESRQASRLPRPMCALRPANG